MRKMQAINHKPRATSRRPRASGRMRGFTLVEMLVVVGITVLMFAMVGVIIRDVTALISVGTATSEVLNKGRTVGNQIARDTDRMLGPAQDGFLVIINQRIEEDDLAGNAPGVPIMEDDVDNSSRPFPGGVRPVRSDQILFFRNRGDLETIAPGVNNAFSGTSDASHVKVWYGHLRRTAPNGTDTADAGYDVNRLGLPDSGADRPVPGTNQLASDWVLGRQAMFLGADTPGNHVYIDTDLDPPPAAGGPGGAWPDWLIGQYSNRPWYYAGSDVLDKELDDIVGSGATGSDRLTTGMTDATYAQTALQYAYPVPDPDGDAFRRLRVNPSPTLDTDGDGQFDSGDDPLSSRVIGQTHPYLAGNVSDFIVEFAADRFDQTGGMHAPGRDGQIDLADTDDDGDIDEDDTGEIAWYDAFDNSTGALTPLSWSGGSQPYYSNYTAGDELGPVGAFVFRHDDDGADSNWPYLIRIRYRLGDDQSDIGRSVRGDRDGRDNDGDGNVDEADEAAFTTTEPGRWFERIIRVPRP